VLVLAVCAHLSTGRSVFSWWAARIDEQRDANIPIASSQLAGPGARKEARTRIRRGVCASGDADHALCCPVSVRVLARG
jgi:hypothetical protein